MTDNVPSETQPATGPARVSRMLDPLAALAMGAAGAALVGMVLVQAWQVFARYVLNATPGWTEPVALLLMSLAVMLGAAIAVRRESHFAFNGLAHAAPRRVQLGLKTASRIVILISGLGLLLLGGRLALDDWTVPLAGAGLPSGLRFFALSLGGALIVLFSVERLVTGDFVPPAEIEED